MKALFVSNIFEMYAASFQIETQRFKIQEQQSLD